jgi:AcrR family transcriptional regulator
MAVVGTQLRRGGRTEKNRQAVAEAVLQLLRDGNIHFELREVAALSGVHRTTIHRRWPQRSDLIAEAMSEQASRIAVEFSGDWEADLRHIAYTMRGRLLDPYEMAINRLLVVTEDIELFKQAIDHWPPILQRFQQPLREAQASGLLDPSIDAELVISTLVSTLLTTTVFLRASPSDKFVDRLIAQLLRGCPTTKQSEGVKQVAPKLKRAAPTKKKIIVSPKR